MTTTANKAASPIMVMLAFATVYIVWGSTYFFIQKAIHDIPPLMMGAMRFIASGGILMLWCIIKGEKLWEPKQVKVAVISGLMLLLVGNGAVIWAEKSLPSSLVAVLVSSAPVWFVVLDRPHLKENLSSRSTLLGLIVGFAGVIMLFSEQAGKALGDSGNSGQVLGLIVLIIGSMSWAGGSLYSKYKSTGSATVNTAWQMMAAGIAFIPGSLLNNEWSGFNAQAVSTGAWLSVLYLIVMGSLVAYSAYVWLLQVRPATQVSTYAYVNPVVAVLLGTMLAGEKMTVLQLTGLAIILTSVLLINLSKYRKQSLNINERKTVVSKSNRITTAIEEEAVC
ncbi:EamA family transporter [Flavihumibacter solisilvae]|uniref:EamA family transporter n=1 Tax=Flavihumibacter solisilvae TaxID=1349421 RepID=UPI000689CF7E|nr:EamA family transporter [Flavihumibacter solisilvae]